MRFPPRVAMIAGIGLAQLGEFGFVLARAGGDLGLLRPSETRVLLGGAVVSMLITPVALRVAPHLAAGASRLRGLSKLLGARSIDEPTEEHASIGGHVVIVGFGIAGRVLASALKVASVPYLVIEINADTVRAARSMGEPAYYGDIASEEALSHARVRQAKSLVLLINDPNAAERAIAAAKRYAPETPVFVRTHYQRDAQRLLALGASDVVVEEVEAGLEMLARALRHAGTPRNVLMAELDRARQATTASSRPATSPRPRLGALGDLADMKIEMVLIHDDSFAAGRSTRDLDVRARTGALIVAIKRGGEVMHISDPDDAFRPGDMVFIAGSLGAVIQATTLLEEGPSAA